jgi:hypothetical protein
LKWSVGVPGGGGGGVGGVTRSAGCVAVAPVVGMVEMASVCAALTVGNASLAAHAVHPNETINPTHAIRISVFKAAPR